MKYRSGKKFIIKGQIVKPFNGETNKKVKSISWSHGFTHYRIVDTGEVFFCGTHWFEENAQPITKRKI